MAIELEPSASSFLDGLDFDESDVAFLEEVTSDSTADSFQDLPHHRSTVLDEVDDEVFTSKLRGDDDDGALGLQGERLPNLHGFSSSSRRNSLFSLVFEGERYRESPGKRSSLVTPEPQPEDTPLAASSPTLLPNAEELQRQYQHTLRKLAKSMRRSDATRSIVKRQKALHFKEMSVAMRGRGGDPSAMAVANFFQSERCKELEETRRQLLRFINI
jgi:hypothetical protein